MGQESEPDQKQCKYRYEDYTCHRNAYAGSDCCIAHKEKKKVPEAAQPQGSVSPRRLNDVDIELSQFRNAVTDVIEKGKKEGTFAFTGFRFPAGFNIPSLCPLTSEIRDIRLDFRDVRSAGDLHINHIQSKGHYVNVFFAGAVVEGDVQFSDCVFKGIVHLSSVLSEKNKQAPVISGSIRFGACNIDGKVDLAGLVVHKGSVRFQECKVGSLFAENANVHDTMDLHGIKLTGGCRLFGAQIGGDLILDEAKIGGNLWLQKGKSKGAEIGGDLRMERAVVKGSAVLQRVQVAKRASFNNSRFEGRMWLADACFGDAVEFHGTALPRTGYFERIKVKPGKGRSLFNFAKRVKHEMGDSEDESDYHYLECWHAMRGLPRKRVRGVYAWLRRPRHRRRDILRGRSVKKPIARGLAPTLGHVSAAIERAFAEYLFRYGERPWWIAFISLGLIVAMAVVLCITQGVGPKGGEPSGPLESAYFSIVTFTTLGLGDLTPRHGFARILVGVEAISGAFLMAAFLVSLARRWGRA